MIAIKYIENYFNSKLSMTKILLHMTMSAEELIDSLIKKTLLRSAITKHLSDFQLEFSKGKKLIIDNDIPLSYVCFHSLKLLVFAFSFWKRISRFEYDVNLLHYLVNKHNL